MMWRGFIRRRVSGRATSGANASVGIGNGFLREIIGFHNRPIVSALRKEATLRASRRLATLLGSLMPFFGVIAQAQVRDGGFDAQGASVPQYCYNTACPAGDWTFSGNAGFIHEGNPAWPAPIPSSAPIVAFLQGESSLRQTVVIPASELSYFQIELDVGSRPAFGGVDGEQTVLVSYDGNEILRIVLKSGEVLHRFVSQRLVFDSTATLHLDISGIKTGDHTAFVDNVSVVASGNSITYKYDALGRIKEVSEASGATMVYSYDAAGNRTTLNVSPR